MELLPLTLPVSGSTTLSGRIELADPDEGMNFAVPIGAFAQGVIGISAQGKDVDGLSVDLFGTCSPVESILDDSAIWVALSGFANIADTAVMGKIDIPLTAIGISVDTTGGSFVMDVKIPGTALP